MGNKYLNDCYANEVDRAHSKRQTNIHKFSNSQMALIHRIIRPPFLDTLQLLTNTFKSPWITAYRFTIHTGHSIPI